MMKYIAFEGKFHAEVMIFASVQEHAQVALNMNLDKEDIIGAGFVGIDGDGQPYFYGQSTSLNIKSRGDEDLKIFTTLSRSSN